MKDVFFFPAADKEVDNAYDYYEARAENLGDMFLARLDEAVCGVLEEPEAWTEVRPHIRRRILRQFPYAIYYMNEPDYIAVISVMHLHRNPICWMDRI